MRQLGIGMTVALLSLSLTATAALAGNPVGAPPTNIGPQVAEEAQDPALRPLGQLVSSLTPVADDALELLGLTPPRR